MKSVIKKFTACLLALTMVLGMSTVAMAATPSSTDTGSITVNGLSEGVTVTAYQIAKATYDEDGNFLGYEMTVSTTENGFKINSDGSYDESTLTEANLAALYAALTGLEVTGSATVSLGTNYATISDLPVGSYLIVVSGSESVAYGMMIGSVSYAVDEDGNWIISNGSFSVEDSEVWAKATTPTLGKTEHHTGGDETHGESANVGDEITFDITISNIPSYQGDNPHFDVDDKLTGLTISNDELNELTVKIMNGEETVATLVKGTDYTVTQISDTEFDVNFVVNEAYTLNEYANKGYTLVIEYQATITEDAVSYNDDGEAEYDNDATLTYSTNSFSTGDDDTGTSEDQDYEYTFAVNASKVDGDNEPLEGATFGLFTDSSCNDAYTQNGQAVTATSGSDGTIHFSGLAEGTYYMKETEAATGYLLNDAVYTVVISADYDESGKITNWTITVTLDGETVGSATDSADTNLSIINTKTGLLPSMGGMGTTLFTIIGLIMVVCALGGVIVYRKRRS